MKRDATIDDLKEEIRHVRTRHPELAEDSAFVLWFILLTGDEERALQSLVGASGDVTVDALLVDDERVFGPSDACPRPDPNRSYSMPAASETL